MERARADRQLIASLSPEARLNRETERRRKEKERDREREMLLLLLLLFDSRCSRARFAHASLSVPSGIAGLLPAKWTIRNDTGGCHFSAKCRVLSAGDDGSRLYIFFLSLLLLLPSLLYISLPVFLFYFFIYPTFRKLRQYQT